MHSNFFGLFLVEKKALTKEQLNEATDYQRKNNRLTGNIAVEKGYMTKKQVEEVFFLQKQTDKKFGEIAFEKKIITKKDLQKLLLIQAENRIYLGEVLVKKGFISGSRIYEYLNEYSRESEKKKIIFQQQMESVEIKNIFHPALNLTLNFFYRMGLNVKPDLLVINNKIPELTGKTDAYKFFTEQKIDRKKYFFGLIIPVDSFNIIFERITGKTEKQLSSDERVELFAETVFLINSILCKELKQKGYNAKYKISANEPSSKSSSAFVRVQTTAAHFYIAYYWEIK